MKKANFLVISILITMVLIFVSYDGINAETKLRNTPEKLNKKDIKTVVKKCNFFDKELNEKGDFPNDFVDNGDGTVTDRATGLMWEQKGTSKEMKFLSATKYVKKLNKKEFAGQDDWRLPTIEELYSLLEPNEKKQRYIHPVFSSKPSPCWSLDDSDLPKRGDVSQRRKIIIDYEKGKCGEAYTGRQMGGASGFQIYYSYVRAVRSTK